MRTRHFFGLLAAAGVASSVLLAPAAVADPDEISNEPACTNVDGGVSTGTDTTTCQTPGNVQIAAAAPEVPTYLYPWNDEYYGPALMIGGDDGPHGGGGGGGGHR